MSMSMSMSYSRFSHVQYVLVVFCHVQCCQEDARFVVFLCHFDVILFIRPSPSVICLFVMSFCPVMSSYC